MSSHDDKSHRQEFLRGLGERPQEEWTFQEVTQLFLYAADCDNLRAAPSARNTIIEEVARMLEASKASHMRPATAAKMVRALSDGKGQP